MFVEEVPAQSAEFVGAKPGFGFEPERVKRAVVAGEDAQKDVGEATYNPFADLKAMLNKKK